MTTLEEPRPECISVTPTAQAQSAPETEIQQFYNGSTVFVTGGTGFVGQLIIEKLLRCCPGIKKIYLLVRPKKNKDIETRLRDQFKDVLYGKLREVNPNFESQVEGVAGDCGEIGLGISNDDRSTLVNEVSVILHSAATVRFDEPLNVALSINTRGTKEIVDLARECKQLKAFVHVSTAYSNCNRPEIEEKFYNLEVPGETLVGMVDTMDKDVVNRIAPELIQGHPNTYTYTKRAAEDIVRKAGRDIPCAVVRPSIICGTVSEPLGGWSGNVYGIGGVFVGIGLGVIHTSWTDNNTVKDIVPGDMVSNTCIAVAWKTASLYQKNAAAEPLVYMCGTSPQAPIIFKTFNDKCYQQHLEKPLSRAIYKSFIFPTPSYWKYKLYDYLFHWIPAYIVDAILVIWGKRPQFKKIYGKINQLTEVLSYFSMKSWVFHNENTVKLYNEMSASDRKIFNFDFKNFNWDTYIETYIDGTKKYLIKEPDLNAAEANAKWWRLELLHYFVCALLVLFVYGVFKLLFMLF